MRLIVQILKNMRTNLRKVSMKTPKAKANKLVNSLSKIILTTDRE